MNGFELIDARTTDEAIDLAAKYGKEGAYFASGADVLYMLKDRIEGSAIDRPRHLIGLEGVKELRAVQRAPDGGLTIGSMTRLIDLVESPDVAAAAPILVESASRIASPQLRHTSTVGGNLLQRPRCAYFRKKEIVCLKKGGSTCWAVEGDNRHHHAILEGGPCHIVHPSDLAPALIAAGAKIHLKGPRGERALPLEDFFVTTDRSMYRENVLDEGELVLRLTVPAAAASGHQRFLKAMHRQADEFSLVSVSAVLALDGKRVTAARLVLGGVSPRPYLAKGAAEGLVGAELTEVTARKAGEAAVAAARPMTMNAYKVDIARNLVARALLDA